MHRDIHCCSSCEHRKNYKDVTVFMIFTPAMSTGHEGRPSLIPSGPAPRPAAPGPPWWQPPSWRSPSESDSTELLSLLCLVQHYIALPSWPTARVASAAPPTGRRCRMRGRCGCRPRAGRGHPRHPPLGSGERCWTSRKPVCGPAAPPATIHWMDRQLAEEV